MDASAALQRRLTSLQRRFDVEVHESRRIRCEAREMQYRDDLRDVRISRAFARRVGEARSVRC